jgi:dienelactone hydrolase
MPVSRLLNVCTLAAMKQIQVAVVAFLTMLGSGWSSSQTLHGFVLTGNPASANGATWVYRDTVEGVIYDLAGILLKPAGNSKLPAVVISHGHNGNVSIYSIDIAKTMRTWALVCIAVNYTHSSGVPIGSPGDSTQPGASMANILRARKCVEILGTLGYVDTTRIAAHGNSMGAFVNAALVGTYPKLFRVASHSAGGLNDLWVSATKTPQATGIVTPYQIHHGDADTTVPLPNDQRLDSLLHARGVEQQMFIYPGYSHTDITFDTTMLSRVRLWYQSHGLLPATGVVADGAAEPRSYALEQNYPNPFNPGTSVAFQLPVTGHVQMVLFDMLGRQVRMLLNGVMEAGRHEMQIDCCTLITGVY